MQQLRISGPIRYFLAEMSAVMSQPQLVSRQSGFNYRKTRLIKLK